jgi:hypothetical protein
MAVITGKDGTAYYVLTRTTLASVATTSAGAGVYQITTANHRNLDPSVEVVVTSSSGVLDLTYGHRGVDYPNGKVKIIASGSPVTGATVTVSGAAVSTTAAVASIFSWSIDMQAGEGDITALAETWADVTPLAKKAICTLDRYRVDTNMDNLGSSPFVYLNLLETGTTGFLVTASKRSLNWAKATGQVDKSPLTFDLVGPINRT